MFKVVDKVYVTFEVYEELSRCKDLVKLLVDAMRWYRIELIESEDYSELEKEHPELGKGELSVIASAKGRIAFIEDRKAERVAEAVGIDVFNIPVLLFVLKRNSYLKRDEIAQIIKELKLKDNYFFKKDIEEELLK